MPGFDHPQKGCKCPGHEAARARWRENHSTAHSAKRNDPNHKPKPRYQKKREFVLSSITPRWAAEIEQLRALGFSVKGICDRTKIDEVHVLRVIKRMDDRLAEESVE